MHTKGEWKWEWEGGQPTVRLKAGLDLIATVYPKIGKKLFAPIDEAEANAHLITASPRMAEWIERIVKQDGWVYQKDLDEAKEILGLVKVG